ncbi:MAG: hypothetical protein HFJ80_06880 [Clostridiales bacterium]|nr:hypothetical protein [Clostridiales bacterium]
MVELIRHRKIRLFDTAVEGGEHFYELDVLSAGENLTVFDAPFGRAGICICFDIRFPKLVRHLVLAGVRLLLAPAAFNLTTGPVHWELAFRSRVADNQLFIIGVALAREEASSYVAYAHSLAVDFWGKVMGQLGEEERAEVVELDLTQTEAVRRQLPF